MEELDSTGNWQDTSNSLCCFGSRRSTTSWWERVRATSSWSESRSSESHPTTWSAGDRWWSRGFMRAREWSEIVAGPRWKTFIRRFSRNRSGSSSRHAGKYQYDPLSYALNFDEGPGQNGDFEDDVVSDGFRNFSARYAMAPPLVLVEADFTRLA